MINARTTFVRVADGLKTYVIGVFQDNFGGDTAYLLGM